MARHRGRFVSSKQQTRREAVRDGQTKRWVLQNVLSINQNADSDHSYSTSTHTTCLKNQSVPDISLVEKEEVVGEDGTSLTEKSAAWRQGRRIVELGFLADALSACNVCGSPLHLSDCAGIFECGLGSVLSVVCRNSACSFVNKISTGKKTSRKWDVNGKLNFALKNTGIGERQLNALLAHLNIPPVSVTMLQDRDKEVGNALEEVATESTVKSLDEELHLVKEKTGEEAISVSVDAGWQKRGSGRAYDSLSGHATMVGKLTGKVVGYAVRSKHCKTCEVAERKKQEPPDHDCRKNWSGSAKGMEPDMVVEMVQKAKDRGVNVKTLIGDEDSTTIARVKANVDKDITKESDSNHIKKIVSNTLHSLRNVHKGLSLKIISYLKKLFNYMLCDGKGKPDLIKEGLKAIPNHVFGNHDYCGQWCRAKQNPDKRYLYRSLPHGRPLDDNSIKTALTSVFDNFTKHAAKLANLGSTQANESLNKSIASKAPKTHHYSGSASLNHRVAASIAQKNIGPTFVMAVNERLGLSPGVYTKKLFLQRDIQQRKRKAISTTIKAKRRRMELKSKRSQQTVVSETREGSTYSQSVAITGTAYVEDIEEIPAPKFTPVFEPLSVGDKDKPTEVYFDLETTGFERTSHITQIAAVRGQERFNIYVMPKKNIQTQASEVTGLKVINGYLYHNNKKLDSDSVSSAMEKFIQFLQKSESNILIGHNIRTFDCHVLFNALRNCEKMQTFLQHVIGFLDTKTLFKATHPEHKKYTQKALFESIVGEEYAAHDALADVNALTSLVETASISDDIKMKLISTTKHVQDCFNYSIEAQHNMPSLKVLVTSKIVSKNMARTIAGSGLQLKHLCYAYRRNGRSGIESVLQEKQSGSSKVRVTRSRKITDSIADYFAHQDGAMKN